MRTPKTWVLVLVLLTQEPDGWAHCLSSLSLSLASVGKYRHTSLDCTLLYCASQMLHFLQREGKTLHQRKDDDLLYCDTCFTAVIWDRTCRVSDVCLYQHMPAQCELFVTEYSIMKYELKNHIAPQPLLLTRQTYR